MREAQRARGEKPRYDGRWRPENAQGQGAAGRRQAGGAVSQSRRRRGRLGRHGQGADRDRQRGARRPDHRALGRHADLQLLRRRRRLGHGDHPRDPRRRSRQQHAAADQHPARARRRPAGLRPPADDPRAGRPEAVQAPRRGLGARVRASSATCRRRSSTTWRASAGATATTRSSAASSWSNGSTAAPVAFAGATGFRQVPLGQPPVPEGARRPACSRQRCCRACRSGCRAAARRSGALSGGRGRAPAGDLRPLEGSRPHPRGACRPGGDLLPAAAAGAGSDGEAPDRAGQRAGVDLLRAAPRRLATGTRRRSPPASRRCSAKPA